PLLHEDAAERLARARLLLQRGPQLVAADEPPVDEERSQLVAFGHRRSKSSTTRLQRRVNPSPRFVKRLSRSAQRRTTRSVTKRPAPRLPSPRAALSGPSTCAAGAR